MTWQDVYQRSLGDLLAAEKARRQVVEADRAKLVHLLTILAQRHDGERLEEFRRQDPGTPEHWSAEEWTDFFSKPPATKVQGHAWSANGNSHQEAETKDINLNQDEKRTNETNTAHHQPKESVQASSAKDQVSDSRDATPENMTPETGEFEPRPPSSVSLTDFSPPQMPYKYKGLLKNHGMTPLRWRRGSMMLYLMATYGINAHLELDVYVAQREGLNYRSNSTKKPISDLAAAGLVIAETLRMQVGDFRTALRLARLTDEGRTLSKALGWPAVESDWDRMIRLHQGRRQVRHTLAVLYFGVLARVRGWSTEIMPNADGAADPDLQVTKGDERYFVEVELGTRGDEKQTAKWQNLADLQGSVALCAPNVKIRERLVADCRLANLSGVATDLGTLVDKPYHEAQGEPLWLKEW